MAPEATAGAAPAPSMDIYSAALVLVELLTGRPLIHQTDTWQALYRIANETLALPSDLGPGVDDNLRAILQRALAREPSARFASAADFRDALRAWAAPVSAPTAASNATLDFLLRRMLHKSDFPALSDSVARIQRVASSEDDSISDLTNEILKDVALTNKLLRLVNSVNFAHASRGSVSTVSRAVSLVGFNAVRNMALSLVLLDHMQNKQHASQMREEFLRSMMAGSLAAELCGPGQGSEEAFIGAMFQNLGRMLCEFYFPEEASQIRALAASGRVEGGASPPRCRCWAWGLKTWGRVLHVSGGCPKPCSAASASPRARRHSARLSKVWSACAGWRGPPTRPPPSCCATSASRPKKVCGCWPRSTHARWPCRPRPLVRLR